MRSELSFKPLKVRLAPPVVRKSTLKPKKVKFSGRNDLYRRVPLVEYYQNPLTRVHLIFWNKITPNPRVSVSAINNKHCRFPNVNFDNGLDTPDHFWYFYTGLPYLIYLPFFTLDELQYLFYTLIFNEVHTPILEVENLDQKVFL